MAYQVIARKYRPQRFADVVGQEHVTQTLIHAIEQNRIAHAYLFCGPRGTGKTTIARIFAKCLNCTGGPKVDFDDRDPKCQEIAEGRSLDVLEIDGASNNGVEQVRELRETCKFAPASSRFKIYIIDEVHMLTTAAFNALLKTLEEPPAHVKFMFATTDPEKVLPTILSRCQRFDLRRIPVALIVRHLQHIARQEKVEVEEAALYAIARGADGGLRDAESALDQLISFCGAKIVESDVLSMFGLTAQGQILALAEGVLRGDAAGVLRELDALAKHGKDLGRLLSDLLGHFRNLLVFQVSGGNFDLLEASETARATIQAQADLVTPEALTRVMEVLTEADSRLRDAAAKRIFVEVALLRAIQARHAVSLDAVLTRLQRLRAESDTPLVAGGGAAPAPSSAPETAPPAARAAAGLAQASTASSGPPGSSAELWPQFLEAVGRVSPLTRSSLNKAHPVSLADDVLTIGFDPEFADQLALANTPRNLALYHTKLKELGHPRLQVKFVQAERPVPAASSAPAATAVPASATEQTPPSRRASQEPAPTAAAKAASPASTVSAEDFKNDPQIKKALELFKARIVDVGG